MQSMLLGAGCLFPVPFGIGGGTVATTLEEAVILRPKDWAPDTNLATLPTAWTALPAVPWYRNYMGHKLENGNK